MTRIEPIRNNISISSHPVPAQKPKSVSLPDFSLFILNFHFLQPAYSFASSTGVLWAKRYSSQVGRSNIHNSHIPPPPKKKHKEKREENKVGSPTLVWEIGRSA